MENFLLQNKIQENWFTIGKNIQYFHSYKYNMPRFEHETLFFLLLFMSNITKFDIQVQFCLEILRRHVCMIV